MRRAFLAVSFSVLAFASSASAQTAAPAAAPAVPAPGAAAVVASEPGRAAVAQTVQLAAKVVGIDKATRTVTLKGPKGNVVDVVAGDEVKNFDQIKLGDMLVVKYLEAVTFELKKKGDGIREAVVREDATRAKPGERPGGAAMKQVVILADVVDVDPKGKTISLRGPKGNVTKLAVQNPDQFKVVKKGDQVEVVYTEAVAIALEPAPKAAPKAAPKK